jgi:ABC-type nitrate/sulfonate/bicarbonate transport system permease component
MPYYLKRSLRAFADDIESDALWNHLGHSLMRAGGAFGGGVLATALVAALFHHA